MIVLLRVDELFDSFSLVSSIISSVLSFSEDRMFLLSTDLSLMINLTIVVFNCSMIFLRRTYWETFSIVKKETQR